MKVGELIHILSGIDPNTNVGVLHNNGIFLAEEVGLYNGTIHVPFGNKMIYHQINSNYIVLGNPGDYDLPSTFRLEDTELKVYRI